MTSALLRLLLPMMVLTMLTACREKKLVNTAEAAARPEQTNERRMDHFTYLRLCMSGEFSSELQSQQDSNYFDIRLRMVPIWENSTDTFYLYVEQAVATSLEKPYRQRIYEVVRTSETTFTSYIYLAPNPEQLVGRKAGDPIFRSFDKRSLQRRQGCEVFLTYDATFSAFSGSTGDRSCPSDRQGAAYTTSEVVIFEDRMVSWDRGWKEDGQQAWGAQGGGYIFIKQ